MIRRMQIERNEASRRRGFTLMEMLIVVAIIVVVAGLGGVYLFQYLGEAKADAAAIKIKILSQQVQAYSIKRARPQSLDVLLVKDAIGGPLVDVRQRALERFEIPMNV